MNLLMRLLLLDCVVAAIFLDLRELVVSVRLMNFIARTPVVERRQQLRRHALRMHRNIFGLPPLVRTGGFRLRTGLDVVPVA